MTGSPLVRYSRPLLTPFSAAPSAAPESRLRPRQERMPRVARSTAATAPPPARDEAPPMAPSTATWPQSTRPVVIFWVPADMPALVRAPLITAAPTGPPTPVHITATPATTRAPAARYSQLPASQEPAAPRAAPRAPRLACW